jgi:hypothetical protein
MPSLWLPHPDNRGKCKRSPFQSQDNSGDISKWGKRDFIEFMPYFVDAVAPIKPDTQEQQNLLNAIRAFYIGVSKWLEVRVLGRLEMLPELRSPQLAIYESAVDLMVATLKFCEQIYPKVKRAQLVESPEALWGLCLMNRCQYQLRASGFSGNPNLRADGKIKGKKDYSQENAQLIKNFKELLKNGEVEGEPVEDFNPEEGLVELLLYEAIQLANAENDEQLEFACKQYLEALSYYDTSPLNDSKGFNLQFWTLISPTKVHISGKSKKNPKPEGFKPKRGRGRPPKGSKL